MRGRTNKRGNKCHRVGTSRVTTARSVRTGRTAVTVARRCALRVFKFTNLGPSSATLSRPDAPPRRAPEATALDADVPGRSSRTRRASISHGVHHDHRPGPYRHPHPVLPSSRIFTPARHPVAAAGPGPIANLPFGSGRNHGDHRHRAKSRRPAATESLAFRTFSLPRRQK